MRIGIPLVGGSFWAGGAVYTANLAAALGALPEDERPDITFFVGPRRPPLAIGAARGGGSPLRSYGWHDGRPPWRAGLCALASLAQGGSGRSLSGAAREAGIDLLFPVMEPLPERAATPWIGWVPDYQCMHFPALWRRGGGFGRLARALSETAPWLVVSSEDARADALRFFGRTRRIRVLPFAILPTAEWYARDPAAVAARHRLPERFVIFPSQFWKHKDHETLIRALALLRDRGQAVTLVLTGLAQDTRDPAHGPALLRLIGEMGLADRVHVLGLIDRADVVALMRRAVGIVQPSRFEGWSALVEEARSLGKKLVVSDLAVHREQQPQDARFFPPGDVAALADALGALWSEAVPGPDPAREDAARAAALVRAAAFGRRFLAIATDAVRCFGAPR